MELTLQSDELFQVMKVHMTTEQEQIFMASHYLYLQHGADSTKFVVDFDNVWKNVDFTQKINAKRLLEKHFTEQIDYKKHVSSEIKPNLDENLAPPKRGARCDDTVWGGQNKETLLLTVDCDENLALPKRRARCDDTVWGGQNKETILLTVDCFKNFCMIASTPKAKTIRSYYIKMENIMQEYYKNFKLKKRRITKQKRRITNQKRSITKYASTFSKRDSNKTPRSIDRK